MKSPTSVSQLRSRGNAFVPVVSVGTFVAIVVMTHPLEVGLTDPKRMIGVGLTEALALDRALWDMKFV